MPTNERLETTVSDVVEIATRAAVPHKLEPGHHYAIVDSLGRVNQVNLDLDEYREHPVRKTGTVKVQTPQAFLAYLDKHGIEGATEVWADESRAALVAVINGHQASEPGWGDHRAVYEVLYTDAWKAWTGIDKRLLPQGEFAEFIEDRAIDIVKPSSADMLEVAQTLVAKSDVSFESSQLLSTGQRKFTYAEEVQGKGGSKGQLEIPTTIELGLKPFEGAKAYKVTARFRYRIQPGGLSLSVALERPEDVRRDAFGDVIDKIADGLGEDIILYHGTPN